MLILAFQKGKEKRADLADKEACRVDTIERRETFSHLKLSEVWQWGCPVRTPRGLVLRCLEGCHTLDSPSRWAWGQAAWADPGALLCLPFLGSWVTGDCRDTSRQLGQEERCFGASMSHQKDRSTAGLGQQERRTGTRLGGAQPLLSAMISQLHFQTTGHLSTRPQLCQQEGLQPGLSWKVSAECRGGLCSSAPESFLSS